jgi:acyl carrier protein
MGDPAMIDSSNDKTDSQTNSASDEFADSPQSRVITAVHELLAERSIKTEVSLDDNLFQVGLNSLDMLNLVLSLEAMFDITIPEAQITIANLRSISTLSSLIVRLMNPNDTLDAK